MATTRTGQRFFEVEFPSITVPVHLTQRFLSMSRILIVDDEQSICWGLSRLGESLGHEVMTASSAEQGLSAIGRFPPDAILLDVRLPGMDGLTATTQFQQRLPDVPIMIMTAYGDLQTAVTAVRSGAFEYLVKPFDLDQVERALTRALAKHPCVDDRPAKPLAGLGGLVGRSTAMQQVYKQIALASAAQVGVLLQGESGTGKELAARAIHQFSDRAAGPFVAANVAAINAELAESELFGHVRGAFTGADYERTGLLAQADGGTLFLDEVADIPLPIQIKLLRALELGEVTPVGSHRPIRTRFRIISATHQNLLEQINAGSFRHDLYYRLGAFAIEMPALRTRPDDIAELAEHFLHQFAKPNSPPATISPSAMAELQSRVWPGNVREFRNVIEHAVIVARGGRIECDHFPEPSAIPAHPRQVPRTEDESSLVEALTEIVARWTETQLRNEAADGNLYEELLQLIEPPLLKATSQRYHGQYVATARRLGLHRVTLRKKLDQYGITDP